MKNKLLKIFTLFFLLFLFLLPSQSIADNNSVSNAPTNHHKGKQQLHGHRSEKMAIAPYVGEIEKEKIFQLAISLPVRNQEKIKPLISDIYNPKSSLYKHYLTVEQYTNMFGPTEQDYNKVINHLKSKGLKVKLYYSNRLLIDVEGNAETIENAFNVRLHYYKRPNNSVFYCPDDEPSLDLDTPILHIDGLDNYILPEAKSINQVSTISLQATTSGQALSKYSGTGPVTVPFTNPTLIGDDFRTAYAPGVSLDGSGQSIALLQLCTYYQNDISLYKQDTGRTNTITNIYLNGWDSSTPPGAGENEVVLDIDMAMCMAPASTIVVYMGLLPVSVLTKIATDNTCKQISTSWGWAYNAYNPYSIEQLLLQEFALQGQSYFDASGDFGALSCDTGRSVNDDLLQTLVGGTELNVTNNSYQSETGWSGSTGGILTNTIIPDYQQGIDMSTDFGFKQIDIERFATTFILLGAP